MVCVPTAKLPTTSVAEPPLRATVPMTVAPSRNCTALVADAGATEAARETLWPKEMDPLPAESVVALAILLTIWTTAAEVAPL